MTKDLKTLKQELVKDAIYHAAIDLFKRKGFNETRIDQIAEAAGISQRSFFRYFATKDDLLGYSIAKRGDVLVSAVQACPAELPVLDVIRKAVDASVEFALSQPQTRQIIEITAANLSARQAHRGGMVEVEDRLSEAFVRRTRHSSKFSLEPRMMATTTILLSDLTLTSWFLGETKDGATAAKAVFASLARLFCQTDAVAVLKRDNTRRPKQRARHLTAR
jgi:AcrR family transcriptional regulator